jgi:broad specificity phosphatase PhoE
MRHGHPVNHEKEIVSCWPEKFENPLTKKGVEEVEKSANSLKIKNIDLIFSSDILRTKETAEIVGKILNIEPQCDERLRENNFGILNGQPREKVREFFGPKDVMRFNKKPEGGEKYIDIEKRMVGFLKSIDKKFKNKIILIVSHELHMMLLEAAVHGVSKEDFYNHRIKINTAEVVELN